MDSNSEDTIPGVQIPGHALRISQEFEEKLVTNAIKAYRKGDTPRATELQKAISRWVKIPGITLERANPGQIKRALLNVWWRRSDLCQVILEIWGDQHQKLLGICHKCLDSRTWSSDFLSMAPKDTESRALAQFSESAAIELTEAVRAILEKYPNLGKEEEVRLACSLVIQEMVKMGSIKIRSSTSIPETQPEDQAGTTELPNEHDVTTSYGWGNLLGQMRSIPADNSCWANIDWFIKQAQQIALDKMEELRVGQTYQQLTDVIDILMDKLVECADYFEIEGVDGWTAERFPVGQVVQVAKQLEDLGNLLDLRNQKQSQPAPTTRAERLQLQTEITQLEDQIATGYLAVQSHLMPITNDTTLADVIETPKETESLESRDTPTDDAAIPDHEVAAEQFIPQSLVEKTNVVTPEISDQPVVGVEKNHEVTAGEAIHQVQGEMESAGQQHAALEQVIQKDRADVHQDVIEQVTDMEISEQLTSEGESKPLCQEIYLTPDDNAASEESPANNTIIRWIICGDLPSAYWLTWGLEMQGEQPLVPSWIIASLQGALMSISAWPDQPQGFLESITELVKPGDRLFEQDNLLARMGLAAGLYYNLVNTNGDWENWLETPIPANAAQLNRLVQVVKNAARKGVRIDPVQVQLVLNTDAVDEQIHSLAKEVYQWIQQAPSKKALYIRASIVWKELVRSPKGDLYQLIEPAAADRRSEAQHILSQLGNWKNHTWLTRHIQQMDQAINNNRKVKPIVGDALTQVVGWVKETCGLAEAWANAVLQNDQAQDAMSWPIAQVRELIETFEQLLPDALDEILTLKGSSKELLSTTGFESIFQILHSFQTIFNPKLKTGSPEWEKPEYPILYLSGSGQASLLPSLANPLLFYPELELEQGGLPNPEKAGDLVNVLTNIPAHTPEEALDGWILARDYRFVQRLIDIVSSPELWGTRVREALRNDLQRLDAKEIEDTVVSVEQALLEGLLAEGEHTDYRSTIESIRKQIRQVDNEGVRNISINQISSRLTKIRESLAEKRAERQGSQRNHWENLRQSLPELLGSEQDLMKKIEIVVENSLHQQDLRSSGEYLAHLDKALSDGKIPERMLFEDRLLADSDALAEFHGLAPGLVDLLEPRSTWSWNRVREAILHDQQIPGLPMHSLPKPRREQVAKVLDAWRRLKSEGHIRPESTQPLISTIMNYLGFIPTGESPVSLKVIPGAATNFQHWRVMAVPETRSPVAQFGSQRKGLYDVIGVWDRPGIEVISSQMSTLMQQTGNVPCILLYFHYLTPSRRELLLSTTHKGGLPMLVVDEALLLYLARQHDTRLRPLLQCALPYAAMNPYFPAAAGRVPPEVFKGRSRLVKSLIEPFGPAIVYGGRQLGKSALLRQVELDFHHPENGQYVIYEDIKSVGDQASGKNYQTDLFNSLSRNEVVRNLERSAGDLDKLLHSLQQHVTERNKRILLLLDEADNFLDADAAKNFHIIQKLKNVMDQTERRFKIVLAGLHNVQRFRFISNQPLAHLDTPIEIGPLEPEAARALLVDPLHALGYRFGQDPKREDMSLVLHILSYTNYHPGLIQLFGSHLVEHLQAKHQQAAKPPFQITRSDVEAVYRKREVRDGIRDRFNLTLSLDPRYEAIVLALILEQWADQNGFDRKYSPRRLWEVASGWWPEAFNEEEVTSERFKDFLDEMVGLGVLSVNQEQSNYRLRSPNLVYLMGTYEQIWERMETISRSTPPGKQALDSYHARLSELDSFSPLTFAQEQALNNPRSGIALIFGSNALMLSNIDQAVKRLLAEDRGAFCEVRIASHSFEAIQQQLQAFLRENQKANTLIACREMGGDPNEMVQELRGAYRICNQTRGRTLRVCFSFGSQAAWQWFMLSQEAREEIEERIQAVTILKRWDRLSIKQRLELETWDNDLLVSERLLDKILDVSGGWPLLLDELFTRMHRMDVNNAIESFRKELMEPTNHIRRDFLNMLGIFDRQPRRLIELMTQPDIQKDLESEPSYIDVLSLYLESDKVQVIEATVEYLKRMSVVNTEPYLSLEPVVARLWHGA